MINKFVLSNTNDKGHYVKKDYKWICYKESTRYFYLFEGQSYNVEIYDEKFNLISQVSAGTYASSMIASRSEVFLFLFNNSTIGLIKDDNHLIEVKCFLEGRKDFRPLAGLFWTDNILFCGGESARFSVMDTETLSIISQT